MESWAGYGVLALFMGGVVFYVFRSYFGAHDRWAQRLGFDKGEKVAAYYPGEADIHISTGQKVATAAVGAVAGALLGGIGVATTRARAISAAISSRQRLAIILETGDDDIQSFVYTHPSELRITPLGPSPAKVNHLPAEVVQIETRDGICVRARITGDFSRDYAAWAGGAA